MLTHEKSFSLTSGKIWGFRVPTRPPLIWNGGEKCSIFVDYKTLWVRSKADFITTGLWWKSWLSTKPLTQSQWEERKWNLVSNRWVWKSSLSISSPLIPHKQGRFISTWCRWIYQFLYWTFFVIIPMTNSTTIGFAFAFADVGEEKATFFLWYLTATQWLLCKSFLYF